MSDTGGQGPSFLNWKSAIASLGQIPQAINSIGIIIKAIFPQGSSVTTSATAGSNGAVPAQVAGYLVITQNGVTYKVPLFNP